LILLAIILGVILLLFGFYKLFHTITGSTIGGIAGAIITAFIFFGILIRFINNSIVGFLALTFLILLSILFPILTIYALLKIKNEPSTDNIKKLIYHIHTPQDAIKFRNDLRSMVNRFEQSIKTLEGELSNLVGTLQKNYLNQQRPPKNIDPLIDLLRDIRNNINDFINEYENYKRKLAVLEADINRRHKEPLRSYLLKILEKEGKEEIENKAKTAYNYYEQTYLTLRAKKHNIRNLALNPRYKRIIDNIFNDMNNLLHSFHQI
jgi:DNA repair exonuclease SbcCD ATPase subunit